MSKAAVTPTRTSKSYNSFALTNSGELGRAIGDDILMMRYVVVVDRRREEEPNEP